MKRLVAVIALCASGVLADEARNVHVIDAHRMPLPDDPVAAAAPPAAQAPELPLAHAFVTGELTKLLGSDRLIVDDSRFGLRTGYAHLDNASYLAVTPELDLHFGDNVGLGLSVPLHVRAFARGFVDHGGVHFRDQDYADASDYARVLRYFTVNRKEDPVFLSVSQTFSATIGHGAIVRRYSGQTDQNVTRVGAQLDASAKWGGIEAFASDLLHPSHFAAAMAFVKPFAFSDSERLAQTSVGATAAADFAAPWRLSRNALGYPLVGDSDLCGTPAQPTGSTCDRYEPVSAETRRAQVVGVNVETLLLRTASVDLKPFADWSRMREGGAGTTLGLLGRYTLGAEGRHAFRTVVEARYFDGNYVPGYFDTFYEVQKYQYITGSASTAYDPKLFAVLNRDHAHKRAGYYLEGSYQYNGGFAVLAAFEDSFHVAGPSDICAACDATQKTVGSRNLTLHIEYPAYAWLQFFASYFRRSFEGAPIDSQKPLGDNTLIYSGVRYHVLPILFVNARAFRSWQADPVLGEMRNVWGGDVDLEFGYEFQRSRPAPPPSRL